MSTSCWLRCATCSPEDFRLRLLSQNGLRPTIRPFSRRSALASPIHTEMRIPFLSAACAALLFALPATAQKFQVFGGNATRASTTVVFFGDAGMGGISIQHGQPQWKAEYDQMLDKIKGKLNRLGKDWWTSINNSVDIEIGGAKLPAGSWVLGLQVDADGKFALAALDSTKAMKDGVLPFGPQTWKPDVVLPLELKKDAAATSVDQLTMTLKAADGDASKATLTIAWGKHELVGNVAVHLPTGGAKK
jgi:hypothetical protein